MSDRSGNDGRSHAADGRDQYENDSMSTCVFILRNDHARIVRGRQLLFRKHRHVALVALWRRAGRHGHDHDHGMTWLEAVDVMVARTKHERYYELCGLAHPDHEIWRQEIVRLALNLPPIPDPPAQQKTPEQAE